MNVVIVNDYAYVNGGAARVAVLSAEALAERGFPVKFFAAVGPTSESLKDRGGLEVCCLNERPYNECGAKRAILSGLWDKGAQKAFENLTSGLDPRRTVVHIHSNRDALSSSVLAPALARFPVVYTCHEYGLACPYACFFDHPKNRICERKAMSVSCLLASCNRKGYDKKLWTYTKQVIQNGILKLPNRVGDVIFVSEFSRRILEPYVGPRARRHVLANPIDANRGERRKLTPVSPFLFVGLFTSGKDPVLAARAAAAANVPIRFVGDGELADEIAKANPNAVITGWLKPEQVRQEMMNARAVVLPTKWYETQGLVVQEAASLGVPAIVSRVCAASEGIDDCANGILIEAGNCEQLSQAMTRLQDDATACEMGQAAHAKFWSRPTGLSQHIMGLLDIYERALGGAL